MKHGTRVREKRTGRELIVIADSRPGEPITAEYVDEAIDHDFNADELEEIG